MQHVLTQLPRLTCLQVAGFERHQLSTLFSGIMSHLLVHVSSAVTQQQQQQQDATAVAAESRRRRLAGRGASQSAAAAAATSTTDPESVQAYCQQVAAALAAHVSARVPFSSSLAPHVLHILQTEVSALTHQLPFCRLCFKECELEGEYTGKEWL